MEPHPHIPILATSGLDHDVKIFSPSADTPTKLAGLDEVGKRRGWGGGEKGVTGEGEGGGGGEGGGEKEREMERREREREREGGGGRERRIGGGGGGGGWGPGGGG